MQCILPFAMNAVNFFSFLHFLHYVIVLFCVKQLLPSIDGNLPFWPPSSNVIKYYCFVITYLWLWIINCLSLSHTHFTMNTGVYDFVPPPHAGKRCRKRCVLCHPSVRPSVRTVVCNAVYAMHQGFF